MLGLNFARVMTERAFCVRSADIMKLKRVASSARKGAIKGDSFISRHVGALSLDFSPGDPNMFVR